MPFEVPEGWVWCKLEEICHIAGRIGFRGYTKEDLVNKGNGAITLSPSNIIDGEMNYSKCTYISWKKYEESPEIQICNGDILLVKTGSSFGNRRKSICFFTFGFKYTNSLSVYEKKIICFEITF